MLTVNCFGNTLVFLRCGYNSAPHQAGLAVNCQQVLPNKETKKSPSITRPPLSPAPKKPQRFSLLHCLRVLELIAASSWLLSSVSHLLAPRNGRQRCRVEAVLTCRRTHTLCPVHHQTFALSDPVRTLIRVCVCVSVRPARGGMRNQIRGSCGLEAWPPKWNLHTTQAGQDGLLAVRGKQQTFRSYLLPYLRNKMISL